ncbi:MAG: ABC transporter permease [Acidobacteriota bacterium]|nr:ABC transporter permease [Acidobacteriota bacterium]
MRNAAQDVRFALRALRKNPLFTVSAVVVLALGVGLNAATFSLFDAVVLKPLPAVGRPGELMDLQVRGGSYPSFRDIRQGGGSVFQGVGAWGQRWLSIAGGGTAEHLQGTLVSAEYFDVLQVRLAAGRGFVRGEEDAGDPVAVVSSRFARQRFGSPANAIGRAFLANGTPFTVVGVAPPEFRGIGFASFSEIWMPIGAWPRIATGGGRQMNILGRNWGWLCFVARMKPGVTKAQAQAAVDLLVRRETAAYPKDVGGDYAIVVRPLASTAAGAGNSVDPARFLGILLGAVGIVLLIACANLANLLLARAAGRRREIAVRQALGASRGRLIRQLLTESVVLASIGGAAGLLVASWFVSLLARVPIPGGATFGAFGAALDLRVLGFAFVLSLVTGGLFGLVPAVKGSRVHLLPSLKDDPPPGGRRLGLNGTLMACQVALCLLLLSGAGLFVRSLRNSLTADLGFQPRGVAIATVNLGLARYNGSRARHFTLELAQRATRIPGVQSAAWTGILPLSGDRDTESVRIPEATGPVPRAVDVLAVGPGYFSALRMPVSAGREFDPRLDLPEGAPVVVVNESAARRFWPGRSALGARIEIYGAERTVVGVVRDSLFHSLEDRDLPLVAVDGDQLGADGLLSTLTLVIKTSGDPRLVLEPLRREVARLDSALPVFGLRTLEDSIGDMLLPQRLGSALLGLFAGLAFLLAEVGVYAVIAGSVARRTRELGIRLALGGRASHVRRMIVRQTALPVAVGIAAGLPITFAATRLLGRFLYGVAPWDPATLVAAVVLLITGGLLAADLPARRAAAISPVEALRHE